jgi:hypothetical protein
MTSLDIQDLQEQWLGGSEIVYIFLSNRTFQEILQINYQENIREDIQAIIYDAIEH